MTIACVCSTRWYTVNKDLTWLHLLLDLLMPTLTGGPWGCFGSWHVDTNSDQVSNSPWNIVVFFFSQCTLKGSINGVVPFAEEQGYLFSKYLPWCCRPLLLQGHDYVFRHWGQETAQVIVTSCWGRSLSVLLLHSCLLTVEFKQYPCWLSFNFAPRDSILS